jgi:predicted ArsR family transcriptional regulator
VISGQWTFLSNHAHVLITLARDPDARMREVAESVGITERAVQHIVRDLESQGHIRKTKIGRRNRYDVVRDAHFRHRLVARFTLGEFLDVVAPKDGRAAAVDDEPPIGELSRRAEPGPRPRSS